MITLKLTDHFKDLRKNNTMMNQDKFWIGQNYFAVCERGVVGEIINESLYTCTESGTVDMPDIIADKYILINWLEEVL